MSGPFPAGVESPIPYRAAATRSHDTSASRWPSSSRATATRPRTRSSSSRSTTSPRRRSSTRSRRPRHRASSPPTAASRYGDPDAAFDARRTSSSGSASRSRAGAPRRSSATASSPTGTRRRARSRPGRTSRALHPARRRRRRARRARGQAPADHAARLGRQLRHQGGGLRLRRADGARVAQARRSGALDRGPARAPRRRAPARRRAVTDVEAASPRTASCSGSATTPSRTWAPTSGRPSRRRSIACTAPSRAPTACSSRRAQPRRADEPLPDRPQPGLRRAAALLRPRADDGDRGAAPRPRPGRARAPEPRSRRSASLPHAFGRRSTTRATTPPASTTSLRLARYEERRAEQARARADGPALRDRARLRGRAVDLEHGLHHARPDGRGARRRAAEVGQRGGRERARRAARRRQRAHRDDAAGPGPRDRLRADRRRRARRRTRGGRGADRRSTRRRAPGRSPPATTRPGSPGVGAGAVLPRPSAWRTRRGDRSAPARVRAEDVELAGGKARVRRQRRRALAAPHRRRRALEPRVASGRNGARPAGDGVLRRAEPRPARRGRPGRLLGRPRLHRRRRRRRGRAGDRRGARARLRRPCTTPAGCSTRCSPTARCAAASPTASAPRSSSGTVYDEDGNLLTSSFMDYLCPTAPDLPPLRSAHRETPSPVHAARREGPRRGQHDERAGGDRERRRRRARPRRRRAAADAAAGLGAAPGGT